jgi:predicted phosphodiesterase
MNDYLFAHRDARSLERIAQGVECDVLLFGHTHIPWQREIAGVTMINTGNVGTPKDGDPRACWIQLDLDTARDPEVTFHRVEYDIAAMAQAIRVAEGVPDHSANDIETGGHHT